jgi:hypothetical protein
MAPLRRPSTPAGAAMYYSTADGTETINTVTFGPMGSPCSKRSSRDAGRRVSCHRATRGDRRIKPRVLPRDLKQAALAALGIDRRVAASMRRAIRCGGTPSSSFRNIEVDLEMCPAQRFQHPVEVLDHAQTGPLAPKRRPPTNTTHVQLAACCGTTPPRRISSHRSAHQAIIRTRSSQ